MTKLQLAQKRNYFKFVLMGMFKPIDVNVLRVEEEIMWRQLMQLRQNLIDNFDNNSRLKGLTVPEHRCWCGKEGKYTLDYVEKGKESTWVCKKHLENKN